MSETSTIPAKQRDRAGKGAARATRREGLVPCIVYGANKEPNMISMDPRVIWKSLESGHFFSTVYTIEVEGGSKEQVLARDVQFHPVTDQPLHVDFVRVSAKTQVHVNVPVVFVNEEDCVGAKEGGIINVIRHELELVCSAGNIPAEIEFDMTKIAIGDTVRISDIELPKGVESAITDRDPVVVNVVPPKTASAEASEDEEDGAEEAAAEEAAEEATEE
ncbi:50S ribosomal protein L25/general stress protein Ctc [Aestuariispira insulae]|uniref:Large ribosomal subunit protein bL25 n=1 Tax=Aestuariispira insulae TaxID=1461337 RepID=A0A3D9HY47_9PROT|nr:50S ribosomal protein L25/general stress protein Ctc [Aestuariispira insulae]RED54291.1 LSU ribosomal protein L25P [Aestuariispira insulae]